MGFLASETYFYPCESFRDQSGDHFLVSECAREPVLVGFRKFLCERRELSIIKTLFYSPKDEIPWIRSKSYAIGFFSVSLSLTCLLPQISIILKCIYFFSRSYSSRTT